VPCPAAPFEDPTEDDLLAAAEKVDIILVQSEQIPIFFQIPHNLGALPDLWLQARLTITQKLLR
jgi:hypothetical protein